MTNIDEVISQHTLFVNSLGEKGSEADLSELNIKNYNFYKTESLYWSKIGQIQ